jgi:hypothetical protein
LQRTKNFDVWQQQWSDEVHVWLVATLEWAISLCNSIMDICAKMTTYAVVIVIWTHWNSLAKIKIIATNDIRPLDLEWTYMSCKS